MTAVGVSGGRAHRDGAHARGPAVPAPVAVAAAAAGGMVIVVAVVVAGVVGWGPAAVVGVAGLAAVAAWLVRGRRMAVGIVRRLTGARPARDPRLVNLVEGLCLMTGLPEPELWEIDTAAANCCALAPGGGGGVLLTTTGLVETLDRVELEAVVAHELAHLASGDAVRGTWRLAVLLGVLVAAWLRDRGGRAGRLVGGLVEVTGRVVEPVAAPLTPRDRELAADLAAVAVTRYPPGLIRALDDLGASPPMTGVPSPLRPLWIVDPERPGDDGPGRAPLAHRLAVLREL